MNARPEGRAYLTSRLETQNLARLVRRTIIGVEVAWIIYATSLIATTPTVLGYDFRGYLTGARDWLTSGSPYPAVLLAGSVSEESLFATTPFIHPPHSLVLFAPFLALPAILWWAVPIGAVVWMAYRWRPSEWAFVGALAVLSMPRSIDVIVAGNTDMWIAGLVAVSLMYRWTAALCLVKPSQALWALVGVRDRGWWVTVVLGLAVAVAFAPLWFEWFTVVHNTSGGVEYLIAGMLLPLGPVILYLGRSNTRLLLQTVDADGTAGDVSGRE